MLGINQLNHMCLGCLCLCGIPIPFPPSLQETFSYNIAPRPPTALSNSFASWFGNPTTYSSKALHHVTETPQFRMYIYTQMFQFNS